MDPAGVRTLHVEGSVTAPLGDVFGAFKDPVLHARTSDHRILDVNPAFLRLFGHRRDEIVGLTTQALFADPADFESTRPELMRLLNGEPAVTFERRVRRHDGRTFLAEFTVTACRAAPDGHVETFSVLRDLTAQRRQEARLATLLRAGDVMASAGSTREALDALLTLVVPAEADMAMLYLRREDGLVERVAAHHALPGDAIATLWRDYPDPPDFRKLPVGAVFTTGRTVLNESITPELVRQAARDERHHELLAAVRMRSSVMTALTDRGRVIGALALVRTEGRDPFEPGDVPYLEELGRKAGVTLVNARLRDAEKAATARWKSLVENAPDWVYLADAEGRIEYINRGGRGGDPERVRGTLAHDWFAVGDRDRVRAAFQRVFATGAPATVTASSIMEDPRRFELRIGPVMREGVVQAVTVTCIDVTQRHAAETALAEKEAHHRFLVENGGDVVVLSTPEGVVRDVSPAVERVLGRAREEVLGASVYALLPEGARERAVAAVRAALVSPEGEYAAEVPAVRADGVSVWLEMRGKVVTQGGATHVLSTLRDVTQRKLAEEALQRSEARHRALLDATTQMVWHTDEAGFIQDLPEWRAYTGQRVEEVRGTGWLDAVHPEDRERVTQTWREAYEARRTYECEYRVRGKDGEYGHFLARAAPRFDANGGLIEYIGTWTDVTRTRRALEQADALRLQLTQSEKLTALGSLVGGVAHEIRTPLTYMGTNLGIIEIHLGRILSEMPPEKAEPLRAKLDARMAEAHEGIDRINRIVEDLRRFTRLKAGHARVRSGLDALVRDAVELFRVTHRGQVEVRERLATTAPVEADRIQVQQIVLNLLQNALDAKPRDNLIRIRTLDSPAGPVIEVEDRGEGIPPEVQAVMWEPFYSTKAEGSGLGLSIVKRIADQHGARVEVQSAPGEGTTFRVAFPPAA